MSPEEALAMRVSALCRRWARVTVFGAVLVSAGVAVAACSSGTSGASGGAEPRSLSIEQASAYAKSQFTAQDRQAATVLAPQAGSFLAGKTTVTILGSTTTANGETIPHGIWPVTRTIGSVTAGDVLVDDFADRSGHLGTGTEIVDVHPNGEVGLFAQVPRTVPGCPGGVGLTSAMVQLETGWVIVGSLPTANGSTDSARAGCLLVLSPTGAMAGTISGPSIDGPWGETVRDDGDSATLFVSNTLVGSPPSTTASVDRGDVVRLTLSQSVTSPPRVTAETKVAGGFPEHADPATLVEGPAGLVVSASGTLYVADSVGDRIVSIPDSLSGPGSSTTGTTVSEGGQLAHPLGLALAPNGDLLATNATNGKIVEITPTGRQVGEYYADQDQDQDPPGRDQLFALAVDQAGTGVLFTKGEADTLALLH
jgi:hypothetical protein